MPTTTITIIRKVTSPSSIAAAYPTVKPSATPLKANPKMTKVKRSPMYGALALLSPVHRAFARTASSTIVKTELQFHAMTKKNSVWDSSQVARSEKKQAPKSEELLKKGLWTSVRKVTVTGSKNIEPAPKPKERFNRPPVPAHIEYDWRTYGQGRLYPYRRLPDCKPTLRNIYSPRIVSVCLPHSPSISSDEGHDWDEDRMSSSPCSSNFSSPASPTSTAPTSVFSFAHEKVRDDEFPEVDGEDIVWAL